MPGEDIYSWSTTAINNGTADTSINFAEGQTRASVNNSARSMMAAHARQRDLMCGVTTTGGTANAQICSSGINYTSLPVGLRILLHPALTNTGPCTLNMDATGAVEILYSGGAVLSGGELTNNAYTELRYDGSHWVILYDNSPKIRRTGDTMSNTLTITDTSPAIIINKTSGAASNFLAGYFNGARRWLMALGTVGAETGGNAGSDFALTRFADNGTTLLGTPLIIDRATGNTTLTGRVTVGPDTGVADGVLVCKGGAGNPVIYLADASGTNKAALYWSGSTGNVVLLSAANGLTVEFDPVGLLSLGAGFKGRTGRTGSYLPNFHNFYFDAGLFAYVDDTNVGQIVFSSDYRIKKDVEELPTMWETVKALRPIKYTQAEYAPHFSADDIERWGFVAHELQETLVPSAATGMKDQPDIIQSPNLPTVVAALTRALQEAMARIEALEAR